MHTQGHIRTIDGPPHWTTTSVIFPVLKIFKLHKNAWTCVYQLLHVRNHQNQLYRYVKFFTLCTVVNFFGFNISGENLLDCLTLSPSLAANTVWNFLHICISCSGDFWNVRGGRRNFMHFVHFEDFQHWEDYGSGRSVWWSLDCSYMPLRMHHRCTEMFDLILTYDRHMLSIFWPPCVLSEIRRRAVVWLWF